MQLRKTVNEMNAPSHFGWQSLPAMQTENLHTRCQACAQARQAVFDHSTVFRGAIQDFGNMKKQCGVWFEAADFWRAKQALAYQVSQSGDAQGQLGFFTRTVGSDSKWNLQGVKLLQQHFGAWNFLQILTETDGHIGAQLFDKKGLVPRPLVWRQVLGQLGRALGHGLATKLCVHVFKPPGST